MDEARHQEVAKKVKYVTYKTYLIEQTTFTKITDLGAYGLKIASNNKDISKNAGFISSMAACDSGYINDPAYGLRCCFEDTNNVGQCLCDGTNGTIDDITNPGSCCIANMEHPDNCLCSGTDVDDPKNPGNCCFQDTNNLGQCLCNAANYTDDPNKSKITKKM